MRTLAEHRQAMRDLCIAHVTSPAENRMRTRTAKEQHALALEEAKREQGVMVPDTDDESATRKGVLS